MCVHGRGRWVPSAPTLGHYDCLMQIRASSVVDVTVYIYLNLRADRGGRSNRVKLFAFQQLMMTALSGWGSLKCPH